ncbi:MAG: citrate lyase subunit alpha, partial [Peptostreptococcaceae bacterium]|nr:citrate lyase subunit alpha [Peptostreptococcaceae bacterium]
MINKAGREIPDDILKDGLEVYQGVNYKDGHEYRKAAPKVNAFVDRNRSESKILGSIKEAIEKSGLKDGMTISFHHHFRNGDYVVNMVMDVIASMGIKDLTICASSLGEAHDPIIKYIEDGTITGLSSSGVRGKIGEAISYGKLKNIAYIRSHGGRVRAIESGDVHIDVAFIGAPTSDEYGNA